MKKALTLGRISGRRSAELIRQLWIGRSTRTARAAIATFAAIAMLTAALATPAKMMADNDEARTFTVDVGFRDPYYQNNVDPAKEPALFSKGDTFIQYGTIFPGGTIPEDTTDFDPVTAPGAIGVYIARGTWITDLAGFEKALNRDTDADSDLAFMTEIFSFTDRDHRGTIMTDGIMPSAHFSAHRVVLGGTRSFSDTVGELREQNIGEHSTNGYCNLRITFKVRKAAEGRGR